MFHQIWKVFSHFFFKYSFCPFLLLLSFSDSHHVYIGILDTVSSKFCCFFFFSFLFSGWIISFVQFSSIAQSCPTLWDPTDCSTPGFPVHHQLPVHHQHELTQTHAHWSVMPSNHLILCRPFLLLPSIFPSIRVFQMSQFFQSGGQSIGSFSFNTSSSNEHSGLISFRMDWLDLLVVQGTLKSLLQHHSSKASILRCSAFFTSNSHIHTWLLEKP